MWPLFSEYVRVESCESLRAELIIHHVQKDEKGQVGVPLRILLQSAESHCSVTIIKLFYA